MREEGDAYDGDVWRGGVDCIEYYVGCLYGVRGFEPPSTHEYSIHPQTPASRQTASMTSAQQRPYNRTLTYIPTYLPTYLCITHLLPPPSLPPPPTNRRPPIGPTPNPSAPSPPPEPSRLVSASTEKPLPHPSNGAISVR